MKTSSWTLEVEYCVRGSDTGLESESGAARFASFTCQSPGVYELPEQISAERLFASLMGFEKWQQGSLRLGGGEISSTDVARRRRKILRLSPIPQLIDGTLAENLFLYRSKNSDLQQTALLATEQELAELSDLRLPPHLQYCTNELNSRILHSNHRLSPDAERRLAVCQTLLARPQILLIPGATLKAWPAEDLEVVIERTRHRAVVLMAPPSKREVCETASSFSDYTRPSPNSSK